MVTMTWDRHRASAPLRSGGYHSVYWNAATGVRLTDAGRDTLAKNPPIATPNN